MAVRNVAVPASSHYLLDAESRPIAQTFSVDPAIADANIGPIRTPVLLQIGTADFLLDLNKTLHAAMVDRGKAIRMEIYEHGYHDFVLGNQGHERSGLPNGEVLLQGALDALDRSVQFVKSGKFAEL